MTEPAHDEGRPASRPCVNNNPAPAGSPDRLKGLTKVIPSGVPLHIALPVDLTGSWASGVVLSPPGRPVVVDGMDCATWNADGLRTLALRLAGRPLEVVLARPALAFWLTSDIATVERWAA